MFNQIAIAPDTYPESAHILESRIQLAKQLKTALSTITVKEPLPAFQYFTTAADSSAMRMQQEDHDRIYRELIEKATHQAARSDRVNFVTLHKIDLLVIGLHRSSLRTPSLWSTVHSLPQSLRCSMLGVH